MLNSTIFRVGDFGDQFPPNQSGDGLARSAFGNAKVLADGTRRVAIAVGDGEEDQRFELDELEVVMASAIPELGPEERADAFEGEVESPGGIGCVHGVGDELD